MDLNLSTHEDGSSKSTGSSNLPTRSHSSQIISSNYQENLSLDTITSNKCGSIGGGGDDDDDDDLPCLIVMGCTRCLMYVMVPSVDGKCPKCNKFDSLLDIFRTNPPKIQRKSRIN